MSMSATLATTDYRSSSNLTIATAASILHIYNNITYTFFITQITIVLKYMYREMYLYCILPTLMSLSVAYWLWTTMRGGMRRFLLDVLQHPRDLPLALLP